MRLPSLTLLAALALPFAAAIPVHAAPAAGGGTIRTVTQAQLQALPASMGDAPGKPDETGGDIVSRSADGQEYTLRGALCSEGAAPACRVVVVQAWIDHAPIPVERLNDANLNVASVSTVYDNDEGKLRVARLVILDGGITLENLRANVRATLDAIPAVLKAVEG